METYFTFDNLYKAYLACRKRKVKTLNHLRFFENLEENLLELEKELQARTYQPGQSTVFIVDKPKVREIFAAGFRDRVVHHLLYSYLSPKFERIFIYDSWACRRGKGTHRAVTRLQDFTFKAQRLSADEQFYLKMDIKSYFTTIDQSILYNMITKKIKSDEILWLTKLIIFHDCARSISPKIQGRQALFDKLPKDKSLFTVPRGKGLPIGNLTSQFFANIYLNELDQFVKHKLGVKLYLRYVDDFLIIGKSQPDLISIQDEINMFVTDKLGLVAHPKKQFIRPIHDGIDFLGYIIRPEYLLIRKRIVGDWSYKMRTLAMNNPSRGFVMMASYEAHAQLGNCHYLTVKNRATWLSLCAK